MKFTGIVFLFVSLLPETLLAQHFSFGLRAGANLSDAFEFVDYLNDHL